jgi:hypothetical protein
MTNGLEKNPITYTIYKMLLLFLAILVVIGILYIVTAFLVKWPPFHPKEGDVCNPKKDDKVDKGIQYVIDDDGDCVLDMCNIGYKVDPTKTQCEWDLTSNLVNIVGSWDISTDAVPKKFNDDTLSEIIIPYNVSMSLPSDIAFQNGEIISVDNDKDKLQNFCRRTCFNNTSCRGVFLYDDNRCVMLDETFNSSSAIEEKKDLERKTKLSIKKIQG